MKKSIIILFVILSKVSSAQTKDDQLYQAVLKNDTIKVAALLQDGGNPNFKKKSGFFELSMLIWAAQHKYLKTSKLLIAYKAEVDWKDEFKTTALMYAAHTGYQPMVELLITNGADPNGKDEQGNSVLSAAIESKNIDVVKLIEAAQNKVVK